MEKKTPSAAPRTPLRANYERVRLLDADAQLRECADVLGNPDVLANDVAEAYVLLDSCYEPPEHEPTPEPAPVTEPTVATEAPKEETPAVATQPRTRKSEMKFGYYWGLGRRKSAVARVRVRDGDGKFIVNKKPLDEFFRLEKDRKDIVAPLLAADCRKRVDVFVNVGGGGTTGQAGAIVLGVARALCSYNPDYEPTLRSGNYLTRDSREVERKKYGQRGARRRFQFSKR